MTERTARRRFATRGHRDSTPLPPDHPAMLGMRTLYPSTVRSASSDEWVLKSGINSTKLGDRINKGAWRGSRLYSLKLEERKTCLATCAQLGCCYGNHVGRKAVRWNVDLKLYTRLLVELDALSYRHRTYAIRLHDLGDFSSVEYVQFWLDALKAHRGLRLWGFTHWSRTSKIGSLIERESKRWNRFRIRFSDSHRGLRTAHVIPDEGQQGWFRRGPAETRSFICIADATRPLKSCGDCGFCITKQTEVVFKRH